MGVPRDELPDGDPVGTDVVIGANTQKPLCLGIPLFEPDMSFGALSEPAKIALALGAEMAGTGICSDEGGMLPEEQETNSRYFYEFASGRFGFAGENWVRCGHDHLAKFNAADLTTWKREMADLSGVPFGGLSQ